MEIFDLFNQIIFAFQLDNFFYLKNKTYDKVKNSVKKKKNARPEEIR